MKMTSTYEIRTDPDGTPFAVETINGKVVAAAGIYEESLESMNLTDPAQVDIEGYLHQDYSASQADAALFS